MSLDSIVLCKSIHHQNTREIAERIAGSLGAVVVDPDVCDPTSINNVTLIGVGSGIYYGRFHRAIRSWVASLPLGAGRGRAVFIYSTSGLPFLSKCYHWPLKFALQKRGFRIVGQFACRGHDTFGPLWLIGGINRKHPDTDDLRRAETFALELAQQLQGHAPDQIERQSQRATA